MIENYEKNYGIKSEIGLSVFGTQSTRAFIHHITSIFYSLIATTKSLKYT